ncbi:L-ribulose-5-phosphate 3-epimerase UlaE [bacterium HR17]|uniref:L-ribulose-5-phosphate 3-epimerase UlaE n=1 Tax=Candidatus Fervidibacter japonicus TaxID=2035412 RepID=A0A2H5XG06_9BACT|nr:L-ribulose-5-phosphate 3-epimerase UlaE [bacterium HR17]
MRKNVRVSESPCDLKGVMEVRKAICLSCVVPQWELERRIALIKDAGYDGFEAHQPSDEGEAQQIKALAAKYGLVVHSVMGGTHWRLPLSAPDDQIRRQAIEGVEQALHFAAVMGAEGVLVVPAVVNEQTDYKTAWELSRQSLKQLVGVAKRLGVQIWVENVWNRFLLSPLEFAAYIDELNGAADSDGDGIVGAYFDVGNILAYGYPQQWIRLLGKRIKRVHLKDFRINEHRFVYLLQGDVNWRAVMEALREVGYDGWLTAELPPYPHAPDQMVFDTARHIDRIIAGQV